MIPMPKGQYVTPIVVTRPASGGSFDARGFYVTGGVPTTINTTASVQPASSKDLLLLPEGERTRETVKVYTATELFTVDVVASRPADRFVYDGRTFEVLNVSTFKMGQLDHTKALASAVNI
jgi:hypothetical protein